jgi:hypothetical protein
MANNKPVKTSFKPGQIGNPNGRPKKYITELRHLGPGYTKNQVMDTFKLITSLTQEQLMDVYINLQATVLERTLARAVLNGMVEGDLKNINSIYERLYGKPTQDINIETTQIVHQVITLPNGDKLLL